MIWQLVAWKMGSIISEKPAGFMLRAADDTGNIFLQTDGTHSFIIMHSVNPYKVNQPIG